MLRNSSNWSGTLVLRLVKMFSAKRLHRLYRLLMPWRKGPPQIWQNITDIKLACTTVWYFKNASFSRDNYNWAVKISTNYCANWHLHIRCSSSHCWILNPLSANFAKWSDTQTIGRLLLTNCFSVFDHFAKLALKGLRFLIDENLYRIRSTFIHYFPLILKAEPPLEINEEYVSYDVGSLFINISETGNYSLAEVYNLHKLKPICSKLISKRLLLKLTTESTFIFSIKYYKQTDVCNMGRQLSVVFSDIYKTKLEKDARHFQLRISELIVTVYVFLAFYWFFIFQLFSNALM